MKELDRNAVREAWEEIFELTTRHIGISADMRHDSPQAVYTLEKIAQYHLGDGVISDGYDVQAVLDFAKTLREQGKKNNSDRNSGFSNYNQLAALDFICAKAMNGAVKTIKNGQEPDVQALVEAGIKAAQDAGIIERPAEEPALPHNSAKWLDDEDLDGLPPPSL